MYLPLNIVEQVKAELKNLMLYAPNSNKYGTKKPVYSLENVI